MDGGCAGGNRFTLTAARGLTEVGTGCRCAAARARGAATKGNGPELLAKLPDGSPGAEPRGDILDGLMGGHK